MNTAITSVPISPTSLGSVIQRGALAIAARIRPQRKSLTREELVELVEMRRMAERLRDDRALQAGHMGRLVA